MILEGRVAAVTAAGSGIGRAGALMLAREGAYVAVSDLDGARAEETARHIVAGGGRAKGFGVNVADDGELEAFIDGVVDDHGRIDILHSHAGIQVEGNVEQASPRGMDDSWAVNVRAHFVAVRRTIPHMRRQGGGAIVVTASNSGVLYDREMVAYATSKHAAVAMVRQMALDYASENIRINALCPGWVDTPFNDPFTRQMGGREALEQYVREQIPMGRWASADEIAEALLFLASDRSSFMTGQALVVDGGECLG